MAAMGFELRREEQIDTLPAISGRRPLEALSRSGFF